MSDAPICQMPLFVRRPYMSNAPICRMPLFVRHPYLSEGPICKTTLNVKHPYLSDTPICQMPLFVRRPYLSDAPICQMPLFVRRPYISDALICRDVIVDCFFLAAFLFGCSFLFLGTGSCSYSRLCSVSDPGSSNSLEFVGSFRNLSSSVWPSEVSSRIMKVMKVTEMSCSNLANFFSILSANKYSTKKCTLYIRKTYILLTPIISASSVAPP